MSATNVQSFKCIYHKQQEELIIKLAKYKLSTKETSMVIINMFATVCLRNQGRTKGEGRSTQSS